MKHLLIIALTIAISGCISSGRYSARYDSAPQNIPDNIQLIAAEPHYVEYAQSNFRPYVVFGKEYTPLKEAKGYVATGNASWYGQKFHGHLTANGEIYNMYSMTAAHRTLPLPSFVRVTNLENGLRTIVRVNDRGPFHDDRVIDLSWAAAKKLDMLKHGTASVKLEVIHVDQNGLMTIGKGPEGEDAMYANQLRSLGGAIEPVENKQANANPTAERPNPGNVDIVTTQTAPGDNDTSAPVTNLSIRANAHSFESPQANPSSATFIQVATINDSDEIIELARGLSYLFHLPTETPKSDDGYLLRMGPITEGTDINNILKELRENGFMNAFEVNVPL